MNDNSNIHILQQITRLDLPPDRILEGAMDKLQGVVVLGYKENGTSYFASSYADGGTVIWLMEQAKKRLLDMADEMP